MYELDHYLAAEGRDLLAEWLSGLADRQARARIVTRLDRLAAGNFGDCKPVGRVWELRIDWGPGYRVYYARAGRRLILLCGGDKRGQGADIKAAEDYWKDWQERNAS